MRAVAADELGGPEVLRVVERDTPVPGPGELLVQAEAAGVNFIDIYQREGRGHYKPALPFIPGSEGAGRVAAVGPEVSGFASGDLVAWAMGSASYAEQVIVPAALAVPVPEGISAEIAAAVMLQGMTAHYLACTIHPVREGDVTVVHAAAGGVGLLLTQIIKQRGGLVIGTTSTAAKAELALTAGADHVTGYDAFREAVRRVSGEAGAHVVYDGVGAATFDESLASLRSRGMMVLYGGSSGPVPPFDPQRLNTGGSLFLTRPTLAHYIADRGELLWRAGDLFEWVAKGQLDVRIGGKYPLAAAGQAHEDLASRRT